MDTHQKETYSLIAEIDDQGFFCTSEGREVIEAAIFADWAKLRSKGWSLRTLALNDLMAHEDICDMALNKT